MTRFARAKGSKSSNERVPENPTSWATMKQQLLDKKREVEDSKKRQEILDQRSNNYKVFLKNKEAEDLKKTQWAEFPGVSKLGTLKKNKVNKANKAINNFVSSANDDESNDEDFADLKLKVDEVLKKMEGQEKHDDFLEDQGWKIETATPIIKNKKSNVKKLKIVVDKEEQMKKDSTKINSGMNNKSLENSLNSKKRKKHKENAMTTDSTTDQAVTKKHKKGKENTIIKSTIDEQVLPKSSKTLKKEKKTKKEHNTTNMDSTINSENMDTSAKPNKKKRKLGKSAEDDSFLNNSGKNKKLGKNKTKNGAPMQKVVKANLTPEELARIEKKKQKKLRQLELRKKKAAELKLQREQGQQEGKKENGVESENQEHGDFKKDSFQKRKLSFDKKKPGKIRDNEEHARRKPFLAHKMFINGKELEIDYVDGFPVKKEDAQRLKKLKKEMIAKGLPRSEINIALKLERRKAEKAFAREKKKVCFNCRKSGHNLSECPELNKDQVAPTSGGDICYKCGSTEHTHYECKVVRGQSYSYATCFVCNEQGHIARHCPDNPKGLYPKGGACNVCGDVTHLKKDCPQYQAQQQKQEEIFRVGTYGNSNPDALEDNPSSSAPIVNKRPNKIIKF